MLTEPKLKAAYETVAKAGETLVEHMVSHRAPRGDRLCEFFRERLLRAARGPADLERIARRVISLVPRDMAVMFRCVPLAADAHKNLALAMTDPSLTQRSTRCDWTSMTV